MHDPQGESTHHHTEDNSGHSISTSGAQEKLAELKFEAVIVVVHEGTLYHVPGCSRICRKNASDFSPTVCRGNELPGRRTRWRAQMIATTRIQEPFKCAALVGRILENPT